MRNTIKRNRPAIKGETASSTNFVEKVFSPQNYGGSVLQMAREGSSPFLEVAQGVQAYVTEGSEL